MPLLVREMTVRKFSAQLFDVLPDVNRVHRNLLVLMTEVGHRALSARVKDRIATAEGGGGGTEMRSILEGPPSLRRDDCRYDWTSERQTTTSPAT
jgi:predicted metal-dependent peptidase